MTKKELHTIGLDPLKDIHHEEDVKNYIVRITSGTSGSEPLCIVKTRRDEIGKRQLFLYGKAQRIVACWGTLNARLNRSTQFLFYPKEGSYTVLSLDNDDLHKDLDTILQDFNPDSFVGFPSFIARVFSSMHNKNILKNLQSIRCCGEKITSLQKKIFNVYAPATNIENSYAIVEVGCISGPRCKYLSENQYHPFKGVIVETVNQDNDWVGEIVVSYRLSKSIYIEKYITGDAGRILDDRCPCGQPVTFEVIGRKNFDYIKFLGATLIREEFERVMDELSPYVIDYRGEAREILHNNRIIGELLLKIIGTPLLLAKDEKEKFLQNEISKRLFVTANKTFANLVSDGIFSPLKIQFENEFDQTIKEIKLRKITM